jgi:hypothetical protein
MSVGTLECIPSHWSNRCTRTQLSWVLAPKHILFLGERPRNQALNVSLSQVRIQL